MSDEPPIEAYDDLPDGGGRASMAQNSSAEGLPSSVHIEVAVLGAMLLQEEAINDALEALVAEDFSLDSHQRISRAISEMAETGNHCDTETVINELRRRKELDAIGGPAYLAFLTEGIPRNFNVSAYCAIIKQKAVLRQLMGIGHDLSVRASDQSEDPYALLEGVEDQLLTLAQSGQGGGFVTILDAVQEAGGIDPYVNQMCDPQKMTGLATGFVDLDAMLGGLQKKELIIVAARASMGKTSMGFNIAENVVTDDPAAVVAFFSIEMSKEGLFKRLIASMARVNARKAQEGWASRDDKIRMQSALIQIAERHLEIDDTSTISVSQMRARCRRLKQKLGRLDLVVIDYLQLVHVPRKYGNREQEVSSISRGLKALAKEIDAPVIALSQVGRGAEARGDKRPLLSDLRESGSQEQDADQVIFLYRDEYYRSADDENCERGVAEAIVAKNRNGSTGTRKLAYQAEFTRFSNLAVER